MSRADAIKRWHDLFFEVSVRKVSNSRGLGVLGLLNDGLESLGVIHREVGEHLTVDFDTGLVDETHEL